MAGRLVWHNGKWICAPEQIWANGRWVTPEAQYVWHNGKWIPFGCGSQMVAIAAFGGCRAPVIGMPAPAADLSTDPKTPDRTGGDDFFYFAEWGETPEAGFGGVSALLGLSIPVALGTDKFGGAQPAGTNARMTTLGGQIMQNGAGGPPNTFGFHTGFHFDDYADGFDENAGLWPLGHDCFAVAMVATPAIVPTPPDGWSIIETRAFGRVVGTLMAGIIPAGMTDLDMTLNDYGSVALIAFPQAPTGSVSIAGIGQGSVGGTVPADPFTTPSFTFAAGGVTANVLSIVPTAKNGGTSGINIGADYYTAAGPGTPLAFQHAQFTNSAADNAAWGWTGPTSIFMMPDVGGTQTIGMTLLWKAASPTPLGQAYYDVGSGWVAFPTPGDNGKGEYATSAGIDGVAAGPSLRFRLDGTGFSDVVVRLQATDGAAVAPCDGATDQDIDWLGWMVTLG